ncbi:flagellar hook-basal body complex protein FliE [Paenibacillus sp.]|uniref:flagellar hook-basal body complex protein FliE n=1 Tax=Paenibacillus sp. TaxID=58172 RepID=UPI002D23C511|nr:flagellar hook-basal body complex protein FliE [Paenibacillus sp.]HZG84404.1 flagellar hook-basal body complex protein FliE [Paenibacillus sp.]
MSIAGLKPFSIATPAAGGSTAQTSSDPGGVGQITGAFANVLEKALQSVDAQEKQVRVLNEQFVTGQISDVHTLVIAAEKAQLGMQLTVQVRNKVIEAYQEIMRTQL